jgi:hypothetical protein
VRGRGLRALASYAALVALSACGLDSLTLEGAIPANPTSLPAGFGVRSLRLADGHFTAQVRASGEVTVAGNAFTVPLGKRELRCEVTADPWSLATSLQRQLRSLGRRERVGMVRTAARLGDSGRPYLLGEALYGPKQSVKGIAQFGAFGSAEGTVACSTEGDGRVIEAFAVIENLAESQRWSDEDGRDKPIYAETNRVFLGDVPMGFEYRYLRRSASKGLSWFKVRGLTGRVGDDQLSAIDDVTFERLDEQRFVRESRVVLMSDGERTYDLTVQREPDGRLRGAGELAGKKLNRVLPSDKPIASDLSVASLFRDLVSGKSSRVVARRLLVEGMELRVADEEFVRGAGGTLVGPGGLVYSLDESGLVHTTEQRDDAETSALRIERTRVHGHIPGL